MPELVYLLCLLTSAGCALLMLRHWSRRRAPLLLWVGCCFVGLALNNLLLFVDMVLVGNEMDLSIVRQVPAVLGVGVLLYGLVWDVR
jgi:hypothetical protein